MEALLADPQQLTGLLDTHVAVQRLQNHLGALLGCRRALQLIHIFRSRWITASHHHLLHEAGNQEEGRPQFLTAASFLRACDQLSLTSGAAAAGDASWLCRCNCAAACNARTTGRRRFFLPGAGLAEGAGGGARPMVRWAMRTNVCWRASSRCSRSCCRRKAASSWSALGVRPRGRASQLITRACMARVSTWK